MINVQAVEWRGCAVDTRSIQRVRNRSVAARYVSVEPSAIVSRSEPQPRHRYNFSADADCYRDRACDSHRYGVRAVTRSASTAVGVSGVVDSTCELAVACLRRRRGHVRERLRRRKSQSPARKWRKRGWSFSFLEQGLIRATPNSPLVVDTEDPERGAWCSRDVSYP